ncbi:MAG: hypothetical protein ACK58T_14090, partial [Phycisphaerae bacterium]
MSQCQVHIVAADEQMISDSNSLQNQLPVLFAHFHQRQIRGASTDVTDENAVADFQDLSPAISDCTK